MDTLTKPDFFIDWLEEADLGEGDPENRAHIIARKGSLGAGALIVASAESGLPVKALCGYEWVPQGIAPDSLEVCEKCQSLWGQN